MIAASMSRRKPTHLGATCGYKKGRMSIVSNQVDVQMVGTQRAGGCDESPVNGAHLAVAMNPKNQVELRRTASRNSVWNRS
jgi:hypothetical protein